MSSERHADIAASLDAVSKTYRVYKRPQDRLREMLGLPASVQSFTALEDVSLKISRGESFGIVGVNGSGKSTLLQILCGTLQPSSGSVSVSGRISALLELGAGFNADFTGRENVYLNGALQGFGRAEMAGRIEAIEAFADVAAHFDQPLKTYSSGMSLRVAFAAAILAEPDILVIDEALAVGDEAFQRKCFARLEQIRDSGATVIFVSHSSASVIELCDRALLLDAGRALMIDTPKNVVNQYQRLQNLSGQARQEACAALRLEIAPGTEPATLSKADEAVTDPADESADAEDDLAGFDASLKPDARLVYEPQGMEISDVRVETRAGRRVNVLQRGGTYVLRYRAEAKVDCRNVGFGMLIKTLKGVDFAGCTTAFSDQQNIEQVRAGESFDVRFELPTPFAPGAYLLNVGISSGRDQDLTYLHRILDAELIRISPAPRGLATSLVDIGIEPRVERKPPE